MHVSLACFPRNRSCRLLQYKYEEKREESKKMKSTGIERIEKRTIVVPILKAFLEMHSDQTAYSGAVSKFARNALQIIHDFIE